MNMNATLFGQAIVFVLFVLFCMKFIWSPIMSAIEKRQKAIADSLSAAELAKKEVDQTKHNLSDIVAKARAEAQEIIDQANKRRLLIIEEAQIEATREKEKIITQGFEEVSAERKRAAEELRKQVAALAVSGAEKIIKREINQAANSDIIDELIAEL